MTLIWSEGFTGDKALALLWQECARAQACSQDTSLTNDKRVGAIDEAKAAEATYNAGVAKAETALNQAAADGQARTHVLVVGVGRYVTASIQTLPTAVFGAWEFADWMLTRFQHLQRPLGSVELLVSPANGMDDWNPSREARTRLGLASGVTTDTLPVEAATFANIENAFERWLKRAGTRPDNAAFFYFSGHGLWKSKSLLLPQDAQFATNTQPFKHLIDIQQTECNMFNTQPSIQCFFIDSCQKMTSGLIQNIDAAPGEPLHKPTNGSFIDRDVCLYHGSYPGGKAYGPVDRAPFFTQELLACLERRGAATALDDDTWSVTTSSLRVALEAASQFRKETEKKDIKFSVSPGASCFTAELCHIKGQLEAFVRISCEPRATMQQARLYVEFGGARHHRPAPRLDDWYTPVPHGNCLVGAEFEPIAALSNIAKDLKTAPPLIPVHLQIKKQQTGVIGGGVGGGGS